MRDIRHVPVAVIGLVCAVGTSACLEDARSGASPVDFDEVAEEDVTIAASAHSREAAGVFEYHVTSSGDGRTITARDEHGATIGIIEATSLPNEDFLVTISSGASVVTIVQRAPRTDADGYAVYGLEIDGEPVSLREGPNGPWLDGTIVIEHPEMLQLWAAAENDIAAVRPVFRKWSCGACAVQGLLCTAMTSACIATCASPASPVACVACLAGSANCWNSFFENCNGACGGGEGGGNDGGGGGEGGGGGGGGGGGECYSDWDCAPAQNCCHRSCVSIDCC
jgi:hypothetical protein